MTIIDYILPVSETKRVIFITYDGAELLDLAGPATVFNVATLVDRNACYECITCSAQGGLITHSGGLTLDTRPLANIRFKRNDTVLVIGGVREALTLALNSNNLISALQRLASKVERYGSVCSGSFLLGAAGLLDGKRTATHWAARRPLQKMYEQATVDEDQLYVQDGQLWTSAGVTTGIDMALAMVEKDHSSLLKSSVAKQLVVYSHRPGSQSQFSQLLSAQARVEQHFAGLVDWVMGRLDQPPKVEEMADFVGMTQRSFYRKFTRLFEQPPGKFVERLRMDHARHLIEAGELCKSVAAKVGFRSEAAFRTAFKDAYGVTPRHYTSMH